MRFWILLFLSVFFLQHMHISYAQEDRYERCLDYWAVGPSGCGPKKKERKKPKPRPQVVQEAPKAVVQTSPTEIPIEPEYIEEEPAPLQAEKTLDERIDEYLENYDKPPREFVAFHLEPTLENAIKWVQAYRKRISRTQQLTYAWEQAEQLYEKALLGGEDLSSFKLEDDLPEVPDFGINLPNFPRPPSVDDLLLQEAVKTLAKEPNPYPSPENPFGAVIEARRDPEITSVSTASRPLLNNQIGGVAQPVQVDYYFSAQCPFCQRFEPGFQQVIQEMGNRINVTCVDMTPGHTSAANINGKIDCSWRPLQSGEAQRMGITHTPSLIIRRGEKQPMERLSGYIDPAELRRFLIR